MTPYRMPCWTTAGFRPRTRVSPSVILNLTAKETASSDALDRGESGRVGPNPDTYEGV